MAKQIKYTDEFRREAADIYQKGNRSAAQVARSLGIHEHTLCRWIKLYEKDEITSSQAFSGQTISQQEYCAKQEFNFTHTDALEYVQSIKKHIATLEKLLLQHTDHSKVRK